MIRQYALMAALLLSVLAFAGCAKEEPAAQQHFPTDDAIQTLIQSRVDEGRAVGIVVGVLEADGSIRIFAAGDAGPEAQSLGERSVFEIGSVTKVFTATLLADMVAMGKVAYDDPVAKFLPEGEVSVPTRGGKEITLLDLATHRSALPRMPDNFTPDDASNPYADYTVEQLYAFLSNHELRRDIGTVVEYSNLGVGLLGHALARVNGSSYEELVRERILDPLDMNNTAITLSDDMQHWLVKGHDQGGNVVSNWDIPTLAGAGALRSDIRDMLKFISANTGSADSPLEEAMRNSHDVRASMSGNMDIGLNWIIMTAGDDKLIWHNGGTGGYHSFAGFDPNRGVGAVVLSNSSHDIDDIGLHLINSKLPLSEPSEPPAERTEVDVAADILETYVGNYPLAADFVLTITVEDATIWAQATGQPNFQIFPESETEFFYKVVDAQIKFEIDDTGNTTGLVLHQGGAKMPAAKQ